jgi:hypothetical protein
MEARRSRRSCLLAVSASSSLGGSSSGLNVRCAITEARLASPRPVVTDMRRTSDAPTPHTKRKKPMMTEQSRTASMRMSACVL